MKKISNTIWGVILIAVGALLALKALGIFDFEIFFDGWWTLLIIIPCGVGIFTEKDKMGNLIGLCIGLGLLLACRDVFSFRLLWNLMLPIFIIVLGVKLIIGSAHKKEREKAVKYISEQAGDNNAHFSAFGAHEINFNGQEFRGAQLTAIFGGIDCDLTERENFNELEREYNAFKKLYEEQWAKTKKAIRKRLINMKNIKEQSEQEKDSE